MRLWIPFAVIGGLAAAVVLGIVVLLATRDVRTYKRLVEERVAAATGRGLAINGALELEPSFSPSITAADVTFANAAWGSRPEMVRLGRVEAQVELLPMLFGTVKIERIVLQDADVFLETDASGRGNWIFGEPKEAGGEARGDDATAREGPKEGAETAAAGRGEGESGGGLPLLVDEVRVEGLTLTYRDGRTGKSNAIALERLTGAQPEPGGPFELNVLAKLDGTEVEAQAVLGPALKDTPVTVTGTLVGARVEIQGTIAEPLAGEGLDLALRVQGDSLVDLGALADARLPAVGPYRLAARLTDQGRVYTLSDVEAELGESDITGTVKLAMAGERPRFEADLAANHLDLAAFSAEPGAEEEGDAEEAAVQPGGQDGAAPKRLFSDEPIGIGELPAIDGRAKVKAKTVALEELSLEDVDLALTLANGVLEVKPLSAKVAGGELRGDLSFLSGRAAPTMTARLELKGAELDELLAESRQRDLVSGKIDVSADLKGSGTSMRELASSLDGRLSLVMGEGKIHNEYLDYIAADLLSALFSAGPREDETTVNCLVARFDVQDGVASVGDLLLDTHRITVAGRGAINLATETVSLTLAPRPKDPSLVSLAVPVDVRGPLASPHARPNPEGVALGVAGLAAGAVVGPLGLLIPMVSSGTGEENPCIAALERAGVAESATPPAEQRAPETAPSSPLDDLLEGIRGLFD